MSRQENYLYKIILVGGPKSGRVSLWDRYCKDQFNPQGSSSQLLSFDTKNIELGAAKVRQQIIRPRPHNRFVRHDQLNRRPHCIIVCWDLSDSAARQVVEKELIIINRYKSEVSDVFLAGTKSDLPRAVGNRMEDLQQFAIENNITYLGDTSASVGVNVAAIFHCVTELIHRRINGGLAAQAPERYTPSSGVPSQQGSPVVDQLQVQAQIERERRERQAQVEREVQAQLERERREMQAQIEREAQAQLERERREMQAQIEREVQAQLERERQLQVGQQRQVPVPVPVPVPAQRVLSQRELQARAAEQRRCNTDLFVSPQSGAAASAEAEPDHSAPKEYYCPISLELMVDPVMAADGNSYERECIEGWFLLHNTSPLTNAQLQHKTLTRNHNLRKLIEDWKECHQVNVRNSCS